MPFEQSASIALLAILAGAAVKFAWDMRPKRHKLTEVKVIKAAPTANRAATAGQTPPASAEPRPGQRLFL